MSLHTTTIISDVPIKVSKEHTTSLPFTKIGRLRLLGSKEPNMDLLDVLISLTKPEQAVFGELKNNLNYKTNTITLDTSSMSKSQKDTYRVRLNSLVKKDLIKLGTGKIIECPDGTLTALNKGVVIMSPYFIVPPNQFQESIKRIWDNL